MNLYPNLYTYTNTTTRYIQGIYTSAKENLRYEEIHAAAQFAFKALAIGFAAWLNPLFFSASFAVGVFYDKQVNGKLDEVSAKFKNHYYKLICISPLLTVIKLPVALMAFSLWVGARLGSSFTSSVDENSQIAASNVSG